MTIRVEPDWWKAIFDEVYLLTDARSVCNDAITQREVDLVCELLPVQAEHRILDLCGGHGRHSLELNQQIEIVWLRLRVRPGSRNLVICKSLHQMKPIPHLPHIN